MSIKTAVFIASAFKLNQLPEDNISQVAFVGRSNVGKSSLINKITNRKQLARISSTPGKTQSINFFLANDSWYLVDLPGYGYARVSKERRADWGKLIEGYLRERPQLRGLIQLVDIRHPPMESDIIMQEWVRAYDIPCYVVATKADKISRGKRAQHLKVIKTGLGLHNDPVPFSALTGEGLDKVNQIIDFLLQE